MLCAGDIKLGATWWCPIFCRGGLGVTGCDMVRGLTWAVGGGANCFFMLALKFLLKILLCYNIGIIFALDYK